MNVHRFYLNEMYLLLDVNSGAVHVVDKLVYDIMEFFDGDNDAQVLTQLQHVYDQTALVEALAELQQLIAEQRLFSPAVSAATVFAATPVVKSLCLHVAHDCNLRCGYCFAGAGDFGGDRGLMSREVGRRAVDFIIANSGVREHCEIDFFGGEPLLNMETVRGRHRVCAPAGAGKRARFLN